MLATLRTRISKDESGMALIEIVVSSMLLVIVALGVFRAFDAGTRATAQERHRARAHSLAEADLSRMKAMQIEDLANLNQTTPVTADGQQYTVVSRADFVTESSTTSTCQTGLGSRDYIKTTSTVTWASIGSRPPVVATSVVTPPSGSVIPNAGSLLVSIVDRNATGVAGATVSGSGPASFSGTTGSTGCVIFRNLPAGSYTLGPIGGTAAGDVDEDGNPSAAQTVSVVADSTNTKTITLDSPGTLPVTFKTEDYAGALVNSSADQVVLVQSNMTTNKLFPAAPLAARTATITATSLFPFTSAYSAYAGTCDDNNPLSGGALGSSIVPPGAPGTLATPGYLKLPALHLTVKSGTPSAPGGSVAGARIRITDLNCSPTGTFRRTFFTNASFQMADSPTAATNPGLPYGDKYQVCADANFSSLQRRNYVRISTTSTTAKDVPVIDPNNGQVETIYLGSGSPGLATGSTATCP
jgi:Tfp pilus assembly protein PilV